MKNYKNLCDVNDSLYMKHTMIEWFLINVKL